MQGDATGGIGQAGPRRGKGPVIIAVILGFLVLWLTWPWLLAGFGAVFGGSSGWVLLFVPVALAALFTLYMSIRVVGVLRRSRQEIRYETSDEEE